MHEKEIDAKYEELKKAQDERDQRLGDAVDETMLRFKSEIEAVVRPFLFQNVC
jgi:hypothetical protein